MTDNFALITTAIAAVLVLGWLYAMFAAEHTREDAAKPFFLFLFAVGSAPVWSSILFLLIASLHSGKSEYWVALPWLLLVATFKYLGISIAIALLLAIAYSGMPGDHARKKAAVFATSLAAGACAGLFMYSEWSSAKQEKLEARTEKQAVEKFVRTHGEFSREFSGPLVATILSSRRPEESTKQYYVRIRAANDPSNERTAVVTAVRSESSTRLSLTCIVPEGEKWTDRKECLPSVNAAH